MKWYYFVFIVIAVTAVIIVLFRYRKYSPDKGKVDEGDKKDNDMPGNKDDEEMPGKHTDRSDKDAPKVIESKDIILFDTYFVYEISLDHFNAKKTENGSVELTMGFGNERKTTVGPEFLVNLQEIIDKHRLAGYNGIYSVTAGLPNEPTSFLCKYESGESIFFKQNAYPGTEWMKDVMELFEAGFPE